LSGSREGGVDRHERSDEKSEVETAASDESTLSSLRSKIKLYIDKISADLPTVEWRVSQAFELALRSMDTVQTTISRMKLAAYSSQLIITVPGNLATFFEFHRAPETIDCGYRATETALRPGLPAAAHFLPAGKTVHNRRILSSLCHVAAFNFCETL
jgi:predicted acylesterase/phospholipase RssA